NMINASFCPFLIKSCVSMRSINDFGPCPSKIGRYIGSAATGPDGVLLTCDQAGSRSDNKAIRENAKARMGKYASGARGFFKRNLAKTYTQPALTVWQCEAESYSEPLPVRKNSVSSKAQSTARPLRKP